MGSMLLPAVYVDPLPARRLRNDPPVHPVHVGGNYTVHGGVLPLLFDHMFGMISHAANRPISRTAFLHVDYRKITPINVPLRVSDGSPAPREEGLRRRGVG